MEKLSQDQLYDKTLQMIGAVSKLPIIKVDREEFLQKEFENSPYLDQILEKGPQHVYTLDTLKKKAEVVVKNSTNRTAVLSFTSGLPANPALMVAIGGVDVVQYFGFAINMAQKIAYLFGEDELFDDSTTQISDAAKTRIIAYLGVMFGAAGATSLIAKTSIKAGENIGKKVAAMALTKTAWYPMLKKVGAIIGQKITKQTVQKVVTKAVPVVGGVISGGITYITFKPMGTRLIDTFMRNLNGDFEEELVLNQAFKDSLEAIETPIEYVDVEIVEQR